MSRMSTSELFALAESRGYHQNVATMLEEENAGLPQHEDDIAFVLTDGAGRILLLATSDGTFHFDHALSRDQFALALVRSLGLLSPGGTRYLVSLLALPEAFVEGGIHS